MIDPNTTPSVTKKNLLQRPHLWTLLCLLLIALPGAAQERWDIDGNGSEDFLFRLKSNGLTRVVGISTDGKSGISADDLGGKTHNYRDIIGAGEFDGVAGMDLLFSDRLAGKLGVWPINSTSYTYDKDMASYALLPSPSPFNNYKVVGIGDLNGDGRDDLLLHRQDNHALIYWQLGSNSNGIVVTASGTLSTIDPNTYEILGTADIDGNGADDVMFHNKSNGRIAHWLMYPDLGIPGFVSGSFGTAAYSDYRVVGLRDLDADGNDDLIFHRKSTGGVVYWLYQPSGSRNVSLKRTGSFYEAIDPNVYRIIDLRYLNSDGRADLLVQHRESGRLGYRLHTGFDGNNKIRTATKGYYRQVPGATAADIPGFPDHWGPTAQVVYHNEQKLVPANPEAATSITTDLLARNHTDGISDAAYRNGRTFLTYPADDKLGSCHTSDPDSTDCHSNPTLAVFDHGNGVWIGSLTLAYQPYLDDNGVDPLSDGHCYSQIMISDDGKIHIFYSAHGHPLLHFTQKGTFNSSSGDGALLNPANWEEVGFPKVDGTQIDHQDLATYVMTFKRNDGSIYVLWRQSNVYQAPTGAPELNGDPCQLNQYDLYEPWYYTRSTDHGKTWATSQMFMNPQYGDNWDTMYLTLKYQPEQDRLHVAFSITKYHNCYSEGLYYGYFNFHSGGAMLAHKPNGDALGYTITQQSAQSYMRVADFGLHAPRPGGLAMDIDSSNRIHIVYTNFEGTALSNIRHTYWTGSAWSTPLTLEASLGGLVAPLNLKINRTNNSFSLLTTYRGLSPWVNNLERWNFSSLTATTASSKQTLMSLGNTQRWIWEAMPVLNGPSTHSLMLKVGGWSNWTNPVANGEIYFFGDNGTQP